MPVSLKFKQAPLGEVLGYLEKVTQVNMHVDPQGLQAEGVTTDQPVTIDLTRDIQLKSALTLILEPLHLNYVIKNEVLEITSEDKRHGQVYTKSYPVADLVIPIPNFSPDGQQGSTPPWLKVTAGSATTAAPGGGFAAPPLAVFANDNASPTNAKLNPAVAAQIQKLGAASSVHCPPPVMGCRPASHSQAATAPAGSAAAIRPTSTRSST